MEKKSGQRDENAGKVGDVKADNIGGRYVNEVRFVRKTDA